MNADSLDPAGLEARGNLAEAGLEGIKDVRVLKTFFLRGRLSPGDVERAAQEVLADPVQETYAVRQDLDLPAGPGGPMRMITVLRKPGVTNAEAESAKIALTGIGLDVRDVQSARTYLVWTKASEKKVLRAARRALGNDVIEDVIAGRVRTFVFPKPSKHRVKRRTVAIRKMEGKALVTLSFDMGLSLTKLEMEAIRDEFQNIGREPTDVELETLAQTWSEHCKHKTLAGAVEMKDEDGERSFANLLKETVFHATTVLDKSWCWSVFEDNAGVIDFDGEDGVCMKVETHNHPSAIEPYGGAGTGIGGVIRDILGTGKGARPVANTDIFCFGEPDMPMEDVPKGSMHPRRVLKGVVAGVRDYGNRMGIPTVNGAILFDPRYVGNPVVYAGCVGLIPAQVRRQARPSGRPLRRFRRPRRVATASTARPSLRSSCTPSPRRSAPAPCRSATRSPRRRCSTSSSRPATRACSPRSPTAARAASPAPSVRWARKVGANVDMAGAPLKYEGLDAFEIWISEAQERMVVGHPPKQVAAFEAICDAEDVEAFVLGEFTGDKRLVVRHGKTVVCDMDMEFLHDGLPHIERARRPSRRAATRSLPGSPKKRYDKDLLGLLGMPQIGSKEWVIRQYDHEVQAGAVVRPLSRPEQWPG